ncbi:MAG: ATP synthase F1 subunit gamma [Bacteroidales bacterium]|nr:ATP synthase F1 subunit gamma [Bacteroidales bacterium]
MASLKEVRTRIASIKSTRQITSAMKMVASSKLLKAQRGITGLRQYAGSLMQMIENLNKELQPEEKSLFTLAGEGKKVLLLAIASNKGLCGTYNALVIKKTIDHISNLEQKGFEVQLFLIGRRAEDYFKSREFQIFETNHEVIDGVNYADSSALANHFMNLFSEKTFDRIDVVYNRFKNAVIHELLVEQFLPVPAVLTKEKLPEVPTKFNVEEPALILEPSRKEVAETMIPKFIQFNIFRILLDASASENGARMTAMQKATDNATELLKNLTLTYNKVRQAQITREIVEIVSGAEIFNE